MKNKQTIDDLRSNCCINNMNIKLKKSTVPKGYNWKIDYTNDLKSFDPSKLSLHLEPEQKKSNIRGYMLAERMKDKGLSANVLDYLLSHTEYIPETWKEKHVYFWGTVYRHADGGLCVRCLCWRGVGWGWSCRWLGHDFSVSHPAAVSVSDENSDTKPSLDTLFSALSRIKALEDWVSKESNFINPFQKI